MDTVKFFDGSRWRTGVKKHCEECGLEYVCRKSRSDRSRFCSSQCKTAYSEDRIENNCAICGATVTRSRSRFRGVVFCSPKCHGKGQKIGGVVEPSHYGVSSLSRSKCGACGKQIRIAKSDEAGYCRKCRTEVSEDAPIRDFFSKDKAASKYCLIRQRAAKKTAMLPRVCMATGYDRHVQTCHLISISAFSPDTPLKVVNDLRNLVLLSPNAHWELDHGLLKPEDFGRKDFYKYQSEVREAGYLIGD